MLRRIRHFLVLPSEVSPFERAYVERTNRLALWLLLATVPLPVVVAWWNDTGPVAVAALAAVALLAPLVARRRVSNPRHLAIISGIAAVSLAALLVHAGDGPLQTEMHFQFFVVLATLAVYGNPTVIVIAAAAIIAHHLVAWQLSPGSVLAPDAGPEVIALHALFVALAAIGTCFIARIFYDNVIRLERKVLERTAELERRRRSVRVLLDNAVESFLLMDVEGAIAGERSRLIDAWIAEIGPDATWFAVLDHLSPDFGERTRVAWQAVVDDFLPVELTLAQMPATMVARGRTFRVEYRIASDETASPRALVVVTDVSRTVAREAMDADREEDLQLLAGLLDDRAWMATFLEEAERFAWVAESGRLDAAAAARALHTLKGNARMTGFARLAALCHDVEVTLAAEGRSAGAEDLAPVVARARRLVLRARTMIDAGRSTMGSQSLRSRLVRAEEHARRAAAAAGKEVEVVVDDGGVRADLEGWSPVWSNLVHGVQNAIDHGIEPGDERVAAGKPRRARIVLRARDDGARVTLDVEDDGRGPDWAAIAARARVVGLAPETDAQIADAVFTDGVTTAAHGVTSGRGVGLAALRAAVMSVGGSVSLLGASGRGATLRIEIPHAPRSARRRSSGSLRRIEAVGRVDRVDRSEAAASG